MSNLLTIIPTAEPFFIPGGRVGCLLVHGFTGTPKEMRWMGAYLAEKGFSVSGIRLAGHATSLEDMLRTRWEDWLTSVEEGWHNLSGHCDQTVILGLSMGGVLSLLFSTLKPVTGVVAMSTPYALPPDPRLRFLRWLHWIQPITPHSSDSDWVDREAEAVHTSYGAYPSRSIIELSDLLVEMRAALPAVKAPVLLMHSRGDRGVSPESMPKIYADLGTEDKEMLWLENSGHVITRDAARQQVFAAAETFIRRVTAK